MNPTSQNIAPIQFVSYTNDWIVVNQTFAQKNEGNYCDICEISFGNETNYGIVQKFDKCNV